MSNKPKTRKRLFIFRRSLALILVTLITVACIVASLLFTEMKAMIDERPELDISQLSTEESSRIFDASGNLVAEIGNKLSDNITYDEMPAALIDAFVSIEDSRFFEHDGFDISRFVVAAIGNIKAGGFDSGASTLTMQIIKNTFFATDEAQADVSIERKVQEISMALDLEEELSKEEILEMYVNKINFGVPTSVGLGKAAEYYFGKEVHELNLSESAYLAGVINAPTTFNAFRNLKAASNRRNEVLRLMQRHGYISAQEKELAQSIKLEDLLVDNHDYVANDYIYSDYIDTVINEVISLTGVSPFSRGMDIYTALVPSQQEAIEEVQNGNVVNFDDDKIQVALVTLNNQNGEIVAIGGGRPGTEEVQRGFNRATDAYRQPGSSMKSVLSYALAFETLGYSTQHIIEDGPYAYVGGDFVNNFSRTFRGDVTVTDAVVGSLNIPAIKALEEVTKATSYGYVIQYLKNLGFSNTTAENFSLGYAIGSANFQASTVEIAASHATIINAGNYIKPHTVTRIEIEGQDPIIPQYASVSAISEEAAYLAAYTMGEAVNAPVSGGTSATLLKQGYPVYGKTGTTDHDDTFVGVGIPNGAGKDSWIVASTSQYTNAIWYGYDTSKDGDYLRNPVAAGNLTAAMANYILDALEPIYTPTAITRPAGVSSITHVNGVFPYARPIEGMDDSLVVTGLIKSEYATLTDLEAPELENLASQNVSSSRLLFNGLKLDVTLSPYPDADKLVVAEPTKEMSATNKDGVTMTRTGRRVFDPSWIFGAVRYGTEVKINGQVVETLISEENVLEIPLTNVQANQNIEVCSFYTWEKNEERRSNVVCETINSGEATVSFPSFTNLNVSEFVTWIEANSSASYELAMTSPSNKDQVGKIVRVSPDFYNRDNVGQSLIDETNFKVTYYDQEINSSTIIGQSVNSVRNQYRNKLTIPNDVSGSATIVSFTVGSNSINSPNQVFLLSDLQANNYNLNVVVSE